MKTSVYVINPLHLKRSIGLLRGKNDKIDSQRICFFIEKNYIDFELWNSVSIELQKIILLNAEGPHRVKIKSGLLQQLQDCKQLKKLEDKEIINLN
ncbi:hypothetical protein IF128_05210 [Empedobacter stercoris]|uniref:Transposase n=1 Tax=Empedobacter stercoris TaxID=1628248 RepID=A0ABX1WNZ8_9FLAO|nr:hypothetical protein [Empedobacter stercoris]MCA4776828.1 hypothetical protein [Empedobacter stercoris]MCA4809147.1 hypothetical protein [Empedobacter stercoris]NOJ76270.1 hypothetical protein [Empedobacter stercoris]QNT15157.1 hypothetical protein HNV03_11095 [Empedobacter stercoris]